MIADMLSGMMAQASSSVCPRSSSVSAREIAYSVSLSIPPLTRITLSRTTPVSVTMTTSAESAETGTSCTVCIRGCFPLGGSTTAVYFVREEITLAA